MTGKPRGLQLFRQLCRTFNSSRQFSAQPPVASAKVEHVQQSARAFAAQAAPDLASEAAASPAQEQTQRQLEHQAHQNLLQSLQVALSEAHAEADNPASPQTRRFKQKANKILREFAPLKLVLTAANNAHSKEDLRMLEKWERQLKLEWSTVERLRAKYVEESANLRKLGKGSRSAAANSLMIQWYPALRHAIEKEQQAVRALRLL